MTALFVDFETRSTVDLKERGLDNYARDPSTDVWCMAYCVADGPVHVWTPDIRGSDAVLYVQTGSLVVAHNAAFELAIWNNVMVPRYGWPELKPEQCECTQAWPTQWPCPVRSNARRLRSASSSRRTWPGTG